VRPAKCQRRHWLARRSVLSDCDQIGRTVHNGQPQWTLAATNTSAGSLHPPQGSTLRRAPEDGSEVRTGADPPNRRGAQPSGLRLKECLRLRVKDVEFERREIVVREGKGKKDRVTMLPGAVQAALLAHLERVRQLHGRDLQAGFGRVQLPNALARKYPNANREWGWQWVFPASKICRDPRFGDPQRYHLHESVLQKAIRGAARNAGIAKPVRPAHSAHPE